MITYIIREIETEPETNSEYSLINALMSKLNAKKCTCGACSCSAKPEEKKQTTPAAKPEEKKQAAAPKPEEKKQSSIDVFKSIYEKSRTLEGRIKVIDDMYSKTMKMTKNEVIKNILEAGEPLPKTDADMLMLICNRVAFPYMGTFNMDEEQLDSVSTDLFYEYVNHLLKSKK